MISYPSWESEGDLDFAELLLPCSGSVTNGFFCDTWVALRCVLRCVRNEHLFVIYICIILVFL